MQRLSEKRVHSPQAACFFKPILSERKNIQRKKGLKSFANKVHRKARNGVVRKNVFVSDCTLSPYSKKYIMRFLHSRFIFLKLNSHLNGENPCLLQQKTMHHI